MKGRTPGTHFCSLSSQSQKEFQKTTTSFLGFPQPEWSIDLLTLSCFFLRKISLKHQTLITFPRDTSCGYFK